MAGKLSDYEKLRLANIDRNQQFLASIGLDGTSSSSSSSARSSSSKTSRKAASRKAGPDDVVSQPSRRSKRTLEGNDKKDDTDVESTNKRSKSSDIREAAADLVQRSSSRAKKSVAFYKDEIQSVDEPKPRKGSGSSSGSSSGKVEVYDTKPAAIPTKNAKGELVFPDYPHFRPNLTPKEVLQKGSFGGTYFRPIYSRVTQQHYSDVWKELPADWLTGLNVSTQVSSALYRTLINRYKEACGGDLDMWEGSGWITHIDPYGWFQWYCRFYQGRLGLDQTPSHLLLLLCPVDFRWDSVSCC